MFKEKTKEKALFRIDVMHRKWSSTSHKVEYFLIPSVIAVGEWMTWRDVLLLIDREASNFVIFFAYVRNGHMKKLKLIKWSESTRRRVLRNSSGLRQAAEPAQGTFATTILSEL